MIDHSAICLAACLASYAAGRIDQSAAGVRRELLAARLQWREKQRRDRHLRRLRRDYLTH